MAIYMGMEANKQEVGVSKAKITKTKTQTE